MTAGKPSDGGLQPVRKLRAGYVLPLPWSIEDQIIEQISFIHERGGEFIVAIPQVEIF